MICLEKVSSEVVYLRLVRAEKAQYLFVVVEVSGWHTAKREASGDGKIAGTIAGNMLAHRVRKW